MAGKKISVIVPVYNAERYLNKCLRSIVKQSHKNLEIILIDDGSTDTSARIIKDYASKDKRIISIHKENGGIGSAYKVALKKVTGDYISFVDSDDYIDLAMYEELAGILLRDDPDIIHFGYVFVNERGDILDKNRTNIKVIEGNENILQNHFSYIKDPSLACRLFKRQLFDGMEMFNQNVGIDEIAIIQILSKCTKMVQISKTYYFALARADSVSRINFSKKKIKEYLLVHRYICNYYDLNKPKFSPYLYIKYLSLLIPVYDYARENKELQHSEELDNIQVDLVSYYHKAKGTDQFKNASFFLRIKLKTFVRYHNFYPFVSFIILYYKGLMKYLAMILPRDENLKISLI